jgi:hypothetical protein
MTILCEYGDLTENGDKLRQMNVIHCISLAFIRGEGIAKKFKGGFNYNDSLKELNMQLGEVIFFNNGNTNIYYLIVKENYSDNVQCNIVKSCLFSVRNHALSNKICKIYISEINNGLDIVQWNDIRDPLYEIFIDSKIDIVVCETYEG